ncbi:MAG: hypothetical protein KAV18_02830 [Candidatus Omnitrophica bacterium]|nr:hypothetical protein [Candidatus Omnitrophota bacterium]
MVLSNQKGMILVISGLVMVVLLILCGIFLSRSISERRVVEKNKKMMRAVHIAEAGLNRALRDLEVDIDNSAAWDDGDINGLDITEFGPPAGYDKDNWYLLPYEETALDDGSYTVELKNVIEGSDSNSNGIGDNHIWVRSKGAVGDVEKMIRIYVKTENLSAWNNAIFSSGGASGRGITGNVDIRGSVHVLGQEPFVDENGNGVYDDGEFYTVVLDDGVWGRALLDTDLAFDLGGSTNIVGNSYKGLAAGLRDLIVDPPQTVFGSEVVETLNAKLRIKYGRAGFSGTATAGKPNNTGDIFKETMDGAYVTDGYAGTKGADNVYSDNGTSSSYDGSDEVRLPSLRDYYLDTSTSTVYPTIDGGYQAYLKANADTVVSGDLNMTTDADTDFNYYNEGTKKGIKKTGGVLTIGGIIYVEGGLQFNQGAANTFTYSGQGSILAEEDVAVTANLLTSGADSYPSNIIGVMTPKNISFTTSQLEVMGVFYAENTITVTKQTDVVGAIMANYFDMGTNVPSVYHVPAVVDNLPPGIVAPDPVWVIRALDWQEVDQ